MMLQTNMAEGWSGVIADLTIKQQAARDHTERLRTCWRIAKHLNNDLGIPAAYADPPRDLGRGGRNREKRRRVTKGIWWSAHVRDLIVSRTYMGEHFWGKQKVVKVKGKKTQVMSASREQWNQANAMLHRNRAASMGHLTHKYLLRGLIRCQCARTFIGVTAKQGNGTERAYYRCVSKYADSSIRDACPRCSAPGLRGEALEASVFGTTARDFSRSPAWRFSN